MLRPDGITQSIASQVEHRQQNESCRGGAISTLGGGNRIGAGTEPESGPATIQDQDETYSGQIHGAISATSKLTAQIAADDVGRDAAAGGRCRDEPLPGDGRQQGHGCINPNDRPARKAKLADQRQKSLPARRRCHVRPRPAANRCRPRTTRPRSAAGDRPTLPRVSQSQTRATAAPRRSTAPARACSGRRPESRTDRARRLAPG